MTPDERQQLIEQYLAGYAEVVEALEGMSDEELDQAPHDGGWSPRRVVHHLADSEMTSALRIRKLIAEPNPTIAGYDEEAFADNLYYDVRPIDASLAAFKAARDVTAELLDRMSEEDWTRTGTHSESGEYSAEEWLRIYAAHAFEHAEQIGRRLR